MLASAEDDWPALLAKLQKVRDAILTQDGIVINLTADEALLPEVKAVVDGLREAARAARRRDVRDAVARHGRAAAARQRGLRHHDPGQLRRGRRAAPRPGRADGRRLLRGRPLPLARLPVGQRASSAARGGGCSLNPTSGSFAFSSYRDPNLQGTLDIYAKTADVLDGLESRRGPRQGHRRRGGRPRPAVVVAAEGLQGAHPPPDGHDDRDPPGLPRPGHRHRPRGVPALRGEAARRRRQGRDLRLQGGHRGGQQGPRGADQINVTELK